MTKRPSPLRVNNRTLNYTSLAAGNFFGPSLFVWQIHLKRHTLSWERPGSFGNTKSPGPLPGLNTGMSSMSSGRRLISSAACTNSDTALTTALRIAHAVHLTDHTSRLATVLRFRSLPCISGKLHSPETLVSELLHTGTADTAAAADCRTASS